MYLKRFSFPTGLGFAWPSYLPIALVALFGILATLIAFYQVTQWERQRIQTSFLEAAPR